MLVSHPAMIPNKIKNILAFDSGKGELVYFTRIKTMDDIEHERKQYAQQLIKPFESFIHIQPLLSIVSNYVVDDNLWHKKVLDANLWHNKGVSSRTVASTIAKFDCVLFGDMSPLELTHNWFIPLMSVRNMCVYYYRYITDQVIWTAEQEQNKDFHIINKKQYKLMQKELGFAYFRL